MSKTSAKAKDPRTSASAADGIKPRAAKTPRETVDDGAKDGAQGAATVTALLAAGGDPATAQERARKEAQEDCEVITVTVPRRFVLTDNNGHEHTYEVGIQEMPRHHAEHWYAKNHGVEEASADE